MSQIQSQSQLTLSKSQIAYRNLTETCKSQATLRLYKKSLRFFMQFLKLETNQYDILLDKDEKLIQEDLIGFISHMKGKQAASASIKAYVADLKRFYDLNDILLNWKKIKSFEPANTNNKFLIVGVNLTSKM